MTHRLEWKKEFGYSTIVCRNDNILFIFCEGKTMKLEKCIKESFIVIGKEGSTNDGEDFIKKLWEDANSHFNEVAHLAKKDDNGNILGYGERCLIVPIYLIHGKMDSVRDCILPV